MGELITKQITRTLKTNSSFICAGTFVRNQLTGIFKVVGLGCGFPVFSSISCGHQVFLSSPSQAGFYKVVYVDSKGITRSQFDWHLYDTSRGWVYCLDVSIETITQIFELILEGNPLDMIVRIDQINPDNSFKFTVVLE